MIHLDATTVGAGEESSTILVGSLGLFFLFSTVQYSTVLRVVLRSHVWYNTTHGRKKYMPVRRSVHVIDFSSLLLSLN